MKVYIVHTNCLVLSTNYVGTVEHTPFVVREQCKLSSTVCLSVFAGAILCPREDLIRQWLCDEWSESLLDPGQGRRYSKVPHLPDQTCHIKNARRPCCWERQQKDLQSVRLCKGVRYSPTQEWLARTRINVYIMKVQERVHTSARVRPSKRPGRSCVATRLGKPLNF